MRQKPAHERRIAMSKKINFLITELAATVIVFTFFMPSAFAQDKYMMGGPYGYGPGTTASGMSEIKVADLNDDGVPEIVYIARGRYLVIMDNEGNVSSSNPLPSLPVTPQIGYYYGVSMMGGNGFDIADLDADGIPEIITTYYGRYLVVLDNQGNLKSYSTLPSVY